MREFVKHANDTPVLLNDTCLTLLLCSILKHMTNTLIVEHKDNGIGLVTFNRPHAHNALNLEAMLAFWHAMRDIELSDTLRVLILTGAGEKAFCSGGDLVELREKATTEDARFFTHIMTDALHRMENLAIPVLGAINGYALGGGSEIALACDMRLIDATAQMGMVQINMGLTPGWGAGQRLLRLVGYNQAMQLLLKGDILQADDLIACGLANEKTAEGQALPTALKLAEQIAERPPKVVKSIKALLRAGLTSPYEQACQTEFELFPDLWSDTPHLQAVEAFFKNKQASKHQEGE